MSGKAVAAFALGAALGTLVGVVNLVAGLADNWWTVPAWAVCGALVGSFRGIGELIDRFFQPHDEQSGADGPC